MRRWLAIPFAAALVAAGTGCGNSTPSPSPPPRQPEAGIETVPGPKPVLGVAEPNAWRRVPPPATPDEIASLLASLGAESQRFVVDWNLVEPEPPDGGHRYAFAPFDEMYEADLRHEIRPLIVVLNSPSWAADPLAAGGSGANNPPAESRLEDWAAFVGAVARRYPRALGIEVWNEPNRADFWGDGNAAIRPDPVRYVQLLRSSYEAVKSSNPRLLVVGGALAANQTASPEGDLPAEAFARAAFEAGAAAYMDAVSVHPYPGAGGVGQTLALIDQVREARDSVGAHTPLWLTEVGVATTGPRAVSEPEQAELLGAICRAVVAEPDVEAIYIHNLIAQAAGADAGFGLAQPLPGGALRQKPAFGSLRQSFSGRCTARR